MSTTVAPKDHSPMLTADGADLLALVELALAEARTLGASQAEAAISMDVGLSVSARLGEVETIEYQRDRGMGVTVYFGTRKGSASTGDLGAAALRETVAKACTIAKYTAEDPCAGLPDPEDLARDVPGLDLSHPWEISPERACDMAIACEAAAMAVDTRRITNSEGAAVSTHRGLRAYGNSLGFLAAYPGTVHSISCSVLGTEGEQMERDYWYSTLRDWRELESADSVGRRAGERTIGRLGARKLATMKAPVLYSPDVARGLIGHFIGAIRGGSQYRRASFLLEAAGTARVSRLVRAVGTAAPVEGAGQRAVRSRRRHDARSRTRGGRRAAGLRAEHVFGAQARPAHHRQCGRHAQPARARSRP